MVWRRSSTHPAAISGVSVAARWNGPGTCGGLSVLLLCNHKVQSMMPVSGMPIFHYFPFFFLGYFWPDPKNTCMLIFSIFSCFIFLFLNFLSLFVFIFCETARAHRFPVNFAKVQWHPCSLLQIHSQAAVSCLQSEYSGLLWRCS